MLGLAFILVALTTTLAFNPGMGGVPGMGGPRMGGPGMGGPGMGGPGMGGPGMGGPGMGGPGMGGPGMGGPGMGGPGMGGMGGMNGGCARQNQLCTSRRCCTALECKGLQGMRTCQPFRIGAGK